MYIIYLNFVLFQDDDNSRLNDHILWADGFLVVFSISDLSSFYRISFILNTITTVRQGSKPSPCVLIANKMDLCQEARKTSEDQGHRLASRFNCPYIETSSRENYDSVLLAFNTLFHEIKLSQKKEILQTMAEKTQSTISQLKETLKSLTDFRTRNNTF